MANNNNKLLILAFIFFAFATIITAQSPAPSPPADESKPADEPTNSALSPFAAVPPSGDLISDIAPSDDGPATGDADAAPVGAPNATYPPSDNPIVTDHYKDYSGSGSIKVATTAIASVFLFTTCLLF